MKAIQVHQPGGIENLKYEENVPLPVVTPGTVLIKNQAIGVNYIDVYHRTGLYPLQTPFSIGRDGAGIVEEVGEGVTHLKKGDRVAYALSATGSYAEYTLVSANHTVIIPSNITNEQATAAMVQGLTAHYLVKGSYNVQKGDKVLVHAAAGGLGRLIVMAAKHLGAFVIGTTSSEEKKKIALDAGCDEVILYTQKDFTAETKRITNEEGVHVVYDSIGKDTFEGSVKCLRPRGFMVSLGNASGKVPPVDIIVVCSGSKSLIRPSLGDYVATREEMEQRSKEVFEWIQQGVFRIEVLPPIPLKNAAEAHKLLESRATTGKLILLP